MSSSPIATFSLASRLAWQEIKGSRRFAVSFILSLCLGMIGFLALDAAKLSFSTQLEARAKGILGADLALSAARPLTESEQQRLKTQLPTGTRLRQEIGLVSMVSTLAAPNTANASTRLVDLRAVDGDFPFYAGLTLEKAGTLQPGKPHRLDGNDNGNDNDDAVLPAIWVAPELLIQMGVAIGDSLKIGTSTFVIADVIQHDPAASSFAAGLAPRIYLSIDALNTTGLIATGSRINRAWLLLLPPEQRTELAAQKVAEALKKALPSSDIRVRTAESASEELGRLLTYLNDYLGLVALVALFLAGVGGAYLFRSFLNQRLRDIAILLSIGGTPNLVRLIYFLQLMALGLITSVLAIAVVLLLISTPWLSPATLMFGKLLPADLIIAMPWQSALLVMVMGATSSALFCLPLLAQVGHVSPASLFQEDASPSLELNRRSLWLWLPALVTYWLLAVYQAHSWRTGSLFVAVVLVAVILLALAGRGLLAALAWRLQNRPLTAGRNLAWQLAGLNLTRHQSASLACFLALSLGALLLNVIPQLRRTLDAELARPGNDSEGMSEPTPSLFLFDIQEEQVEPLTTFVASQNNQLEYVSPMIRARLESINDRATASEKPLGQATTREDDEDERSRNRGFNLSYRMGLSGSESIIDGSAFTGAYINTENPDHPEKATLAELSLEERFAKRLGVGVGDRLAFDVQGVSIAGKIVNIRRVRWTSFQPNFFVQFQPGVLDEAPKTFVAAVPAPKSVAMMSPQDLVVYKANLQSSLVRQFPNVSIIDVDAAVKRLLDIIDQITTAITVMALLTIVAGLAVLFSIAHQQAMARQRDIGLIKILGASFGLVRQTMLTEFAGLGFAAALLGGLIGIAGSYLLATQIFSATWQLSLTVPLTVGALVTILAIITGLVATSRSLRATPLALLT